MHKLNIIAFVGTKGTGKTTASYILRDIIGDDVGVIHLSFAAPIKKFGSALYSNHEVNFIVSRLKEYPDLNAQGLSARTFMTSIAKAVRKLDPYAFANAVRDEILKIKSEQLAYDDMWVIIDDVRFKEEHEVLKQLGAKFVYIDPEPESLYNCIKRKLFKDVNPSEQGLSYLIDKTEDIIIDNSLKNKDILKEQILKAFNCNFCAFDFNMKLDGVN